MEITRIKDDKNVETWLLALEDQTEKMSDWENEFIESISDRVDNGESLSMKQYDKLEAIYRKFY